MKLPAPRSSTKVTHVESSSLPRLAQGCAPEPIASAHRSVAPPALPPPLLRRLLAGPLLSPPLPRFQAGGTTRLPSPPLTIPGSPSPAAPLPDDPLPDAPRHRGVSTDTSEGVSTDTSARHLARAQTLLARRPDPALSRSHRGPPWQQRLAAHRPRISIAALALPLGGWSGAVAPASRSAR